LQPGTTIDARHFVPGQFIDIIATSNDKGFQGGMKRWGFGGQPASHGNSLAHRSIGSIGCAQTPGKVWKGKKMPGHMGNNQVTVMKLLLYKIDTERNLLFIKGSYPGKVS
jgi:large subunit ribosomal protein L3